MPNPKFSVEGKTYKKNIPNERIFDNKRYYLVYSGKKKDVEFYFKKNKSAGHLVRIIKTPNGYEDAKKKPYSLYTRLKHWDKSDR